MKRGTLQDTESKILDAAEHEFVTKGFSGARTTSIAESAGVTHAMLHYYFRTKEKLFERIVAEKVMMLRNIIGKSLIDDTLSIFELIKRIIDDHLEFLSENPDLPRFLITELLSDRKRSELVKDKIIILATPVLKKIQDKIDEAFSKGECRHIDSRKLMLDIISLNVFPYMASPLVNAALDNYMIDPKSFLSMRKKDNYETIIRLLNPNL